jgi:hypothetical protein
MFDLTNTIRDMKKRLGKLPSNAFKQLSAKDAEENFNHAAKQRTLHLHKQLLLLSKKLTLPRRI